MAHDVVALHGFTGHPEDFSLLRARLPQHAWRGPVLYGHGPSAPRAPAADPWAAAARSVRAVLAPGSVLLGYSMGGRIALEVARQVQRDHGAGYLAGLVLVGATPGIADDTARAARRAQDHALAAHIESVPLGQFLDEWADKPIIASQRAIPAPHRDKMQARKRALTTWGLANSLRGVGTGSMPPLWDDLPALPTLLLTGARDAKFSAIAAQMYARMPRATLAEIPGVGHCAHLEDAAAAAQAIHSFLTSLPAPGG